MDVTENTFTKKRNSGGIPNNETIPWKHFCSEICIVWLLEDPKAIAAAEKTHFSAWIFFTKFPRLLDAILHNLHKLNQSMLNLGQFFAELKISTTKNGKKSQKKSLMVNDPTIFKPQITAPNLQNNPEHSLNIQAETASCVC